MRLSGRPGNHAEEVGRAVRRPPLAPLIARARPRITRQLNSAIFSSSLRAAMAASTSVRGAAGDFIGLTVLAAATGGAAGTGTGFAEDGAATGDISGNATKRGSAGAAGTE
jgi:hypothetical protein